MIIAVLVVLGLIFGSFANATIWRLHEQSRSNRKAKPANLSITTGRSVCTHCGHVLTPRDLVPVLSYLALRGKCRYCRKPIDDTPLAELLVAGLFTASYIWWPGNLSLAALPAEWIIFGLWLAVVVGFVILALYDLRWFLLPDRVVFPLVGIAFLQVLVRAYLSGPSALVAAFWGITLIAGLFYLLYVVSRGTWIGFGDVKLAIVLGLLVGGPFPALLTVFLASFLGSLAAVPLVMRGKPIAKTRVPFGPFLIAATVLVVLFGHAILTWYLRLLGPASGLS